MLLARPVRPNGACANFRYSSCALAQKLICSVSHLSHRCNNTATVVSTVCMRYVSRLSSCAPSHALYMSILEYSETIYPSEPRAPLSTKVRAKKGLGAEMSKGLFLASNTGSVDCFNKLRDHLCSNLHVSCAKTHLLCAKGFSFL